MRPRHARTRGVRRAWGLAFALTLRAALTPTAAGAADSEAVALPPFIVEEQAKGPPWRYAELPGYEILSRCDDATTRKVVQVHHNLHDLLAEILPPSLRLQLAVPRTLILYDELLQPAASQEVIQRMVRRVPDSLDETAPFFPGGRGLPMPSVTRRYTFLPNLRLWDHDSMALFMIVRRESFDNDRLALTPDYISFLVKRRLPSLPPWFISGFLAMYQETRFESGELAVGPLVWVSGLHHAALLKDPKAAPAVPPLLAFLQHQLPAADPEKTVEPFKLWQSQAALFVRWGLAAERSAYRESFWKFVERCALRGASEELFAECFGFSTAEAGAKLTAFLPVAARRTHYFQVTRKTKPPALVLHDASDLQLARIKGDWERLEVPYVKEISAELAPKYLEQARRTLRRPYDRGEREPALLAVMGLCECDAGNDALAHELLESAAALGPIRPRANYELARLRFAALRTEAAGAKLNAEQVASVLRPLFAARGDEPPLPQVYELIAEVWGEAAPTPNRGHLGVLDEGVRLFPRRLELLLRTAELNARYGYADQAAALAEIAERFAEDADSRARLARLRAPAK